MRGMSVVAGGVLLLALMSCGGGDDGVTPDTTPPTVTATDPVDGASGVPAAAVITVTFSENVNPATVTPQTFTIDHGVTGTITVSGRQASFAPAISLVQGITYTAGVTTGIKDMAGNSLAAARTWSFGTVWTSAPPVVLATVPPVDGVDILIDASVTAIFSKVMNPASITSATFLVGSVAGTITCLENIATFTPDAHLAFNTQYSTLILASAQDSAGIPMADNAAWSFTTGEVRIMDGPEYFPMADGDTWYYTAGGTQKITRVVDGDTLVNGVLCRRVLENGQTKEAWTVDTTGFHVHLLDRILWFVPPLTIPFDLVLEQGYNYSSTVNWIVNDTLYQSDISGTLKFRGYFDKTVPAGTFTNTIKLFYIPDGYSEYYARGVGLLDNGDYVLDSAYVGGIWYR